MKKLISILLSAAIMARALAGCSGSSAPAAAPAADPTPAVETTAAPETAAPAEEDATRTVVDMEGNSLTIPKELKSIAITSWKGAFGAAVLLGQLDKVTVMSDTSRYFWMQFALPQLADIPDYGSFNNVNIEELVKANADVIISPLAAAEANEQMKKLGLPVYVDGITPANADSCFADEYAEIDALAEMTGTEDVAARFYK